MKYFDIHSHLYFADYDSDREKIISSMKNLGIFSISVGTNIETSQLAINLANDNENLFACIGVHPAHFKEDDFKEGFLDMIRHPKVVAVGECGFDYFRLEGDLDHAREVQTKLFNQQIKLAIDNRKALMLHLRSGDMASAYTEALDILERHKRESGDGLFGNVHFFSGRQEDLRRFLDIGFTVSFTGVITFVKDYDELVRYTPDDMIHAETDSPFVAPSPYRGKRNSPEYVLEVIKKMAEIKGLSFEQMADRLALNAKRIFML